MQIKKPIFQIKYSGKNITADVSKYVISVTYSDAEEDQSDEVVLTMEDSEANWRDEWYPTKGDTLELEIGYEGEQLTPCGKFVIDELETTWSGTGGDIIQIKALAAGINKKLRTKRSVAHEKQTLKQIAEKVASANGLTVKGDIPNVSFNRVTQDQETDVAFLRRVSREYGCMFSVRDNALCFTSIFEIEKGKVVRTIDRTETTAGRVVDKSVQTYKKAVVKYADPETGKVVSAEATAGGTADGGSKIGGDKDAITADDALEIRTKAENEQQARLKAQSALHRANSREQEGSLTVYGEPLFVAGNNFELTGCGKVSGKCHITKTTHKIDRNGGYTTDIEFYRLKDVQKPEQRKPKKPTKKRATYQKKGAGTYIGGGVTPYSQNDLMTS